MIDKHKDKRKYNNFGYLSTKFWLRVTTIPVTFENRINRCDLKK